MDVWSLADEVEVSDFFRSSLYIPTIHPKRAFSRRSQALEHYAVFIRNPHCTSERFECPSWISTKCSSSPLCLWGVTSGKCLLHLHPVSLPLSLMNV